PVRDVGSGARRSARDPAQGLQRDDDRPRISRRNGQAATAGQSAERRAIGGDRGQAGEGLARRGRQGEGDLSIVISPPLTPIEIGLTAAIVTVEGDEPAILLAGDRGKPRAGLPFGPFDPLAHRTFEIGLRAWVEAQTGLAVGYVEQLYTFGDRGRHALPHDRGPHIVSVGYLALTRLPEREGALHSARFE